MKKGITQQPNTQKRRKANPYRRRTCGSSAGSRASPCEGKPSRQSSIGRSATDIVNLSPRSRRGTEEGLRGVSAAGDADGDADILVRSHNGSRRSQGCPFSQTTKKSPNIRQERESNSPHDATLRFTSLSRPSCCQQKSGFRSHSTSADLRTSTNGFLGHLGLELADDLVCSSSGNTGPAN